MEPETTPPRRRRKEARPGEIVDAGIAEFAEKGFAATRLEDVARRAGIAKGTIYRYYDSKEALFLAAMRARIGTVLVDVEGLVGAFPGTTQDLIRLMIERAYANLVDGDTRVLVRIVLTEAAHFPELVAHYHAETIARGRRILEAVLRRGVARGEVREGPIVDLPIVLMAPALMAAIWKMTFEPIDPIPTEAFRKAHLDMVMAALAITRLA